MANVDSKRILDNDDDDDEEKSDVICRNTSLINEQ
jgi:hypothetical protein